MSTAKNIFGFCFTRRAKKKSVISFLWLELWSCVGEVYERVIKIVGCLEIVDFDFFYCHANLKQQNDRLLKDLICLAISSERKKGLVEQGQGQVLVGH